MSEQENVVENEVEETTETAEEPVEQPTDTQNPEDDIEKIVEERLAKMKSNMDRMAKERDEALKLKAEIEQAKKEADMERLREEGKLQELAEMKAADLEAKLKVMEEENIKLKRDNVLNDALGALEFRNDRSRAMARQDIVGDLVQDEQGQWVHKSGQSIADYVLAYSKDDDNSFLFRVKSNSGAGTATAAGTPDTTTTKSIGELTTSEILAMAAKGQLGTLNY